MCGFLNPMELKYPSLDALIFIIKYKGRGCALFKRNFQRVYRLILIDSVDSHHSVIFPGGITSISIWWCQWDLDWSAALWCRRTTNLLTYIARKHGIAVENHLDDFMGVEVCSWSPRQRLSPNLRCHLSGYFIWYQVLVPHRYSWQTGGDHRTLAWMDKTSFCLQAWFGGPPQQDSVYSLWFSVFFE